MSASTLLSRFEGLVCDLDGVVYAGPTAIPHATAALEQAKGQGVQVVYATNNASRTPQDVAQHLQELGLSVDAGDVVTSATAGAQLLADSLDGGARVLAVGGDGVTEALRAVGLRPVRASGSGDVERPVAVLQGYGAAVTAQDLADAAYAVQDGARWVATNTDRTLPTQRGRAPGNGTLVDAVRAAVDRDPQVVGKPGPAMYERAVAVLRTVPSKVLGIGDRLETDIAGAHAAGLPALLVLTGVHGMVDLVRAAPEQRPEYVVADLRELHSPYAASTSDGSLAARCEGSAVRLVADRGAGAGWSLELSGHPSSVVTLRAALTVLWRAIDDGEIARDDAVTLWRSSVA
ncbi:HAD-IIA family hydrolase [Luteipulveratus halotolerans]|uniref:HAD-IIA family hydrolase n=1 Tax=Luteipulveratus halotolerans TaxID=1631356 RepID=UPI001E3C9B2D|nr:HAD-IIA family hydrolase [Luteipulveratus halotolerans]